MKKVVIVLLCLFILCGCEKKEESYDMYDYPEGVTFEVNDNSYDVYTKGYLYELIGDNNVNIITEDSALYTNEIGDVKKTVIFEYDGKEYKKDLSYKVIDSESPIFISAASVKKVKVNDDFYPCDSIVYADNYDREPTCEIQGDIDLTQTGTYKIEYVIKDSSNNEKRKDLKVYVVNEIETTTSTNESTRDYVVQFDDAIKKYKTDNTSLGIDVSRWQTDINFEELKEAGVEFVIMRLGVQSDNDKELSVDSYYYKNIEGAKKAGLKVGVYLYSTATKPDIARAQARWVLEILDGIELDFPVAFDWENWTRFMKYRISTHDLNETFNAFYDELAGNGYSAMLYSSKSYLESVWTNSYDRPVWLAHYTQETTYKGNYFLWQMCDTGRVKGINGPVDIDIMYNDRI